ncbi:hypothetical protein KKC1_22130, partial [Calderihabitans maritimus]
GQKCKVGNHLSGLVLIGRGLDLLVLYPVQF